jgi:hypothetical protein
MNDLDPPTLRTLWALIDHQAGYLSTLSDEVACAVILQELTHLLSLSQQDCLTLNRYIHDKVYLIREVLAG